MGVMRELGGGTLLPQSHKTTLHTLPLGPPPSTSRFFPFTVL